MKDNNFKIGIEIECVVNSNFVKVNKGSHRSRNPMNSFSQWFATSDGSLNTQNCEFSDRLTCEYVNVPITTKKGWDTTILQFKNHISNKGKHKLKDVICFNKSCGNHIHFSINKHKYKKFVPFNILVNLRDLFFSKIKKSNIKSKKLILSHYFRSYAKKITEKTYFKGIRGEFNLGSESSGKGLEWRSINMRGIKTWEEFDEFFNIIWECLSYLYKVSIKYSYEKSETIITSYSLKGVNRVKERKKIKVKKRDIENINLMLG